MATKGWLLCSFISYQERIIQECVEREENCEHKHKARNEFRIHKQKSLGL